MPHLTPLIMNLWLLTSIGTGVLLIAMAWTSGWRRWPAVFTFLALIMAQAAFDAAVILAGHHPALYYYGHWTFAAALDLCEVAIMVEIAIKVFGVTPQIRQAIIRILPSIAFVLLVITLVLAFSGNVAYFHTVVTFVALVDVAVSLAWFATFLLIVFGVKAFGPEWSGGARGVALGFWVEAGSTALCAFLFVPGIASVWMGAVKSAFCIVTLICWSSAVPRSELPRLAFPRCFLRTTRDANEGGTLEI